MEISRYCKLTDLNWAALPDLPERVKRLGFTVNSCSAELQRFPDSLTYSSFGEAAENVRLMGAPRTFTIRIRTKKDEAHFSLTIMRAFNIHRHEFISLTTNMVEDANALTKLTESLGLMPDEAPPPPRRLRRRVFVAHRFDEHGTRCADGIARFLELLGFSVVTGRGYSPRSVSDKVRERISDQDLLIVILTPGSDDTWIKQEPIFAEARDKEVFLLKHTEYEFKPGLFGDSEYIPFDGEHIEATFTPILEGLRELNFDFMGDP